MKKPTTRQQQQRELAWLLYITSGASANLASSANFCKALPPNIRSDIQTAIVFLARQERVLRAALKSIE